MMLEENFEPDIVAFCCHYCAYAAADLAGSMRLEYPDNVRVLRLPCTGKIEVAYLLAAFAVCGGARARCGRSAGGSRKAWNKGPGRPKPPFEEQKNDRCRPEERGRNT